VTLTIHTEEDEQRQLQVTAQVPEERVQEQMRRTARKLAQNIRIPGFRQGKVPYNVLVRRVGEEALRAEAVEELVEPLLAEIFAEIDADAIAYRQPTLDDIDLDPTVLKLTIPLEPRVALGDYRAIRKEILPVEVTEEAVAEALERVQEQHQTLEDVERPAERGDLVTVSGTGKTEGEEEEEIWHEHGSALIMDSDKTFPDLPFVDNVVGLSAGEDKEFRATFPEDFDDEHLAGKSVVFNVMVEKVQRRELPPLDDELAQKEGEYETLDDLRQALRKELFDQATRQARSDLLDEVVGEVLQEAELVYPPAVVESELDNTVSGLREQVSGIGWQWNDYLKLQGTTEAKLRDEWREQAIEQVRRGLVLRQLITEEKLTVQEHEIDSALEERLSRFNDNEELREQLRSLFRQGRNLEMMTNDILMDKVHDRIEAIVTGNAPDLAELEAARPKPRHWPRHWPRPTRKSSTDFAEQNVGQALFIPA
jgi:trigger factor